MRRLDWLLEFFLIDQLVGALFFSAPSRSDPGGALTDTVCEALGRDVPLGCLDSVEILEACAEAWEELEYFGIFQ
ncbi:MAG: hypothetical protein RQ745_00995 [Longimicrobiales bacterium]|nr:hypothetical protein [Longimicrobiales bacterium]